MEWSQRDKPVRRRKSTSSSDSPVAGADRRAEERFNAEGEVCLSFDEPLHREITGELVDYSNSGFRAVHHCAELHTGQLVQFRHVVACGTAKVIWNRILPERVESGFLVVAAA
jgi:hypothetical protein